MEIRAAEDAEIVERVLSGDLEVFGELHRRYFPRLVQKVRAILREQVQAEDMAQDAFLAALRDLPNLSDPSRFYPWLCRIAVNRAIDERRRSVRRADIDGTRVRTETPPLPESALDELMKADRAHWVRAALDRLPEGQRAALVLRFFDDLPLRDVAEALGCGEITARTQVFRALRKLGVLLAPDALEEKRSSSHHV